MDKLKIIKKIKNTMTDSCSLHDRLRKYKTLLNLGGKCPRSWGGGGGGKALFRVNLIVLHLKPRKAGPFKNGRPRPFWPNMLVKGAS